MAEEIVVSLADVVREQGVQSQSLKALHKRQDAFEERMKHFEANQMSLLKFANVGQGGIRMLLVVGGVIAFLTTAGLAVWGLLKH